MPSQPHRADVAAARGGPGLEAILLVGGQGTRLRPLTIATPKPLLPTAGVPFLAHQLAKAAASGITRVLMATFYRAEMFAECLGDGSAFGLEIGYIQEETPLDTGGAIRNAASGLRGGPGDPVVVLNGDVLSGHDLAAQVTAHEKAGAAVTLHLVEVPDPARFGCVPTDADGRVTAFLEKTPHPVTNRINAGCYVFTRHVIDQIPPGRVSVERETFPGLISRGELILGHVDIAYWLDVGTPEAFVRGSCDLVLGELASPALPGPRGPSLALPGAVVGPGAVIRSSTVGRGARIGGGTVLDGAVIGDGARIASGNELARGLRVWPDVEIGPTSIRFSTDA